MSKHKTPSESSISERAHPRARDVDTLTENGLTRRDFLASGTAGLVAGAVGGAGLTGVAEAAQFTANDIPLSGTPERRVLLKGGVVLTMDSGVGDFEKADVLIDGSKIARVAPNIAAATGSVIDAANMIVMPGFVDTHRHIWQGQLRNILPNGRLAPDYGADITGAARDVYRPEDVYVGDLLSAWGAISAGITTLLDWSHASNSPEHSDAAIRGLRESGIRGVYGFGTGAAGPNNKYPGDLRAQLSEPEQAIIPSRLRRFARNDSRSVSLRGAR